LSIYDPEVHLSRLLGANRSYIERHVPHIAGMLRPQLREVIEESEALVVGIGGDEVVDALSRFVRSDQWILDLVKLPPVNLPAAREGLSW
jgi:GDP-mannose 6-dehydrogenase